MLADVCDRPNLTQNADYDVDLGVYDIDLGPVILVSYKFFLFLESCAYNQLSQIGTTIRTMT